ncbi:MAG: MFS transporter [Caldilinea sp.]|nr:MFS transporter [Caldilinea sp.]MDW8439910.1 MFS transporter [Caldilineaceae bacterium]
MWAAYVETLRNATRNAQIVLTLSAVMGLSIDGGVYSVVFNLYLLRLNFGPEFVGQINSVANLTFALGSLAAGWLGMRYGNRRIMIAGMGIALVGALALPFGELIPRTARAPWLTTTLLLAYLGLALYFVNSGPFLIRVTPVSARGAIFAVQSAISGLASFAGGLLGGMLPALFALWMGVSRMHPGPYRMPLLLVGALMVGALLLVLQTREPEADEAEPESLEAKPGAPRPRSAYPLILFMSIVRFLQVAGVGVAVTFFNVYMDAALHVATPTIGMLAAVARLIAVPAALIGPAFARRVGYGEAAMLGSFGSALSLLPLALFPNPMAAGFGFISLLAFTAIRYPTFYVYIMERTPPRLRATMTGAGEMAAGFSFALISLLGGYIIVQYGYAAAFWLGAVFTLAGTALFAVYVWKQRKRPTVITPPPLQETAIIPPLVGQPALEEEEREGKDP